MRWKSQKLNADVKIAFFTIRAEKERDFASIGLVSLMKLMRTLKKMIFAVMGKGKNEKGIENNFRMV